MEEASSSSEIYAEIAKRLDKLDDHGKSVLERLKTRLLKEMEDDKENEKVKQTEEQVEAMLGRVRRQTSFWNEQLLRDTLGRHDDEDDNVAIEEVSVHILIVYVGCILKQKLTGFRVYSPMVLPTIMQLLTIQILEIGVTVNFGHRSVAVKRHC